MIDRVQAERVRDYLGLSEPWFKRRYLRRLPNDETALTSAADGKCVFLLSNGRCRVYPVRPLQCQTYPFWPENLDSGKSWERESCRCEGIGRGEEIPSLLIEKTLQHQVNGDRLK